MILLALDTATEACSAALLIDGRVLERFEIAPRRHAELLLPMVQSLLDEAGVARGGIDAIAVGRGPGAFTGVRLAVAMAQGLALALDRPLLPVSTLHALALQAAPAPGDAVLASIDARMGEVYAAAWQADAHGALQPCLDEQVCAPAALVLPPCAGWHVRGTGWSAHRDVLAAGLGHAPRSEDGEALPRAGAIARLGADAYARGEAVAPELAQPVYLRDKVALTLQEQRARR